MRWYLRFGVSYRDLEKLLAERGIEVNHVTLYRWGPTIHATAHRSSSTESHSVGDRWFVDQTYVKVTGQWRYVYRAVDQYGHASTYTYPRSETPPLP